ncbi:hypothetical protein Pan216_56640 [Planctomycetes bacterium Pan216]|uniref:Polymerase nucleotidyl transferase domain-containing protein n=1 Tax=Kolteria novifilia TaxID=2527975 RepID=A0A518BCR5_9BACT|nr:hypothetical protein Pan216_56640 [Planctomycetes bacterium Pan216]
MTTDSDAIWSPRRPSTLLTAPAVTVPARMRRMWDWSSARLEDLAALLAEAQLPEEVVTIAVVGSLSRREASHHSDLDLLVIVRDSPDRHPAEAKALLASIQQRLSPVTLAESDPVGIFTTPIDERSLLDRTTLGQIDEAPAVFGKRFHLLLEGIPLNGAEAYQRLAHGVVDRYRERETIEGNCCWATLLDDLVRYHRSLSLRARWRRDGRASPAMRMIKFAHARRLSYAGLLALLAESSLREPRHVDWLAAHLWRTPLERLALIHEATSDDGLNEILTLHANYLDLMANPEVRESLHAKDSDKDESTGSDHQRELLANGVALAERLQRFFLRHGERWGTAFASSWWM